ncbi:MAG TPA: lysophospholipid acyltransferase family protein [Chloroflexota bacterium]|nr:lysophospholipid acyltransferase family protein [Chloroflexota bacterium]
MNPFYEACRPVIAALLWALADFRLEGKERVPREGPLIVASNHLHLADPPLLGGVLPRYVRFMAKQEAFKFPFGLIFAPAYGAFPVRRNQMDRQALRRAERILSEGGVVGMFPEGHRSHGKGLLPAFDGAALLARRSGAPILPVGIAGTEAVFNTKPRWPITVRIGEPFRVRTGCPLSEATRDIMCRIAGLLPERYRGVYSSSPTAVGEVR